MDSVERRSYQTSRQPDALASTARADKLEYHRVSSISYLMNNGMLLKNMPMTTSFQIIGDMPIYVAA